VRKVNEEEAKRPEGRVLAPLSKVPGKKFTASKSPIRKDQSADNNSLGREVVNKPPVGELNKKKQVEEAKKAGTKVVTIKKQKEVKVNRPKDPPLDNNVKVENTELPIKELKKTEGQVVEKQEVFKENEQVTEVIEDKKVESIEEDKKEVDVNPEADQNKLNELKPELKEAQVNEKEENKVEEIRKESVEESKEEKNPDTLLDEYEGEEGEEIDIADVMDKMAEEVLDKEEDPLEDVDAIEAINKKVND